MNYHTLIKNRRKALRMSRREVAEKACVSSLTVARVENDMICRLDTFLTILDALGLKIEVEGKA